MTIFIKHILLTAVLCFFILNSSCAQSHKKCFSCKEEISGSYIEADGRYFHPSHFTCSKCGNVINGAFAGKDGKYYHTGCFALAEGFVCGVCSKAIEGQYFEEGGKKFHPDCYKNSVVSKCAVCGKPLMSEYTIDPYGNKYHSFHSSSLPECDNCSRIISEATTSGGTRYSDGRYICGICSTDPVFDSYRFNMLLSRVEKKLKDLGLNLPDKSISIRGVDRNELRRAAGSRYEKNMHGFCLSQKQTEYLGNRVSKSETKYQIFVLNGVPPLNTESVIAHELMHVWLSENTKENHTDQVREGSCNYMSYLYLSNNGSAGAQQIIRMLENNPDDVYGKGFLRIRSGFEGRNLFELLNYLKR